MKISQVFATVDRIRRRAATLHTDSGWTDAGPDDLEEYVPWLSQGRIVRPRWLRPLTEALSRAQHGEAIELCVSVPPRHGKSTTIHYWVAHMLSRDPTKRVLYCSYDETFAAKNVAKIRALVAPPYQSPGAIRAERDRARALKELGVVLPTPRYAGVVVGALDNALEFSTAAGGGVRACGIQAPPTGEGYDVIIVDDPIRKMADAMSRKLRDTIGEGFVANLYSRRTPNRPTSYVVVATRWHEDDLTGRLGKKGWQVINLPALDDAGKPLAPELFRLEELHKIRDMNAFSWAALYMGDPAPREGRLFGDAFFVDAVPADGRRVMGVDLSHTAKARSDRHALVVLLDPGEQDGSLYVVDYQAMRGPLTDVLDPGTGRVTEEGFVHALAVRPHRAAMYTGGGEDLVLTMLSRLGGASAHVEPRKAISDKRTRAHPVATAWNAGRIKLPREPWAERFAEAVMAFTGKDGEEDEEVDCLSVAYDMMVEGAGVGVTAPGASTRDQRLGLAPRRKRWS